MSTTALDPAVTPSDPAPPRTHRFSRRLAVVGLVVGAAGNTIETVVGRWTLPDPADAPGRLIDQYAEHGRARADDGGGRLGGVRGHSGRCAGLPAQGAGQEEIGRALRGVAAGEAVYGPEVARRIRSFFTAGAGVAAKPFPGLSDREREVLDLMAGGQPNPVIARRLYLSDKTVRNYVTSIFMKLDVPDRSAAIVKARESGFGRAVL